MRQRYFEWIDGEDKENVEILESIEDIDGEIFYNFIGGNRCNQRFISKMTSDIKELKGKFMVEIESPSNPWTFATVEAKVYKDESMKGDESLIPTMHDILQANGNETEITNSDLGTQKLQAPRMRQNLIPLPDIMDFAKKLPLAPVAAPAPASVQVIENNDSYSAGINNPSTTTTEYVPEQHMFVPEYEAPAVNAISSNPIKILVDKCKKHPTEVELSVTIDLPSKSVYDIAEAEFENGGEEFVNFIIQDIDVNMIIDSLRDALLDAFSEKNDNQKNEDK